MRRFLALMASLAAMLAVASNAEARLASNRLAVNRLAPNQLAAGKLAVAALALPCVSPPSTCTIPPCSCANADSFADLLATAEGIELLGFILSCALPSNVSIVATDQDGTELEFFGGLGLAPRWLDHPLNKKGQGLVSACLFARVNDNDVTVPLSMRGQGKALAVEAGEAESWTQEEGAFYGQYFTADGEPMIAVACRGRDQAAGEGGGLAERDCAEPDPLDPTHTVCGFTFAGDCADYTPAVPSAYACKKRTAAGFYGVCHDQSGLKKWPHTKTFKQVITTFVQP